MAGYLDLIFARRALAVDVRHADASRQFLTVEDGIAPFSDGRGISAANLRRAIALSITMTKESKPLWVWLSLALLAVGSLTYVTTVFLFEYITGLF